MVIRASNGNIYNFNNLNEFVEVSKINTINMKFPYLIRMGFSVNNHNIFYTIYESNSEEERDKVIEKIWDKIKLGNTIIDINVIVDSLNSE